MINKWIISLCALLILCCGVVSAQNSYVEVEATSDGGIFNFTGDGAYWDWHIDVTGFDEANVDLKNHWERASSNVKYEDIDDGTIYVKVTEHSPGDEMYYFDWLKMPIDGDGVYSPGGARNVELVNSANVTGWIEYRERTHKAVFLFDTRHSSADLTVVVHNGDFLENATVILANGNQKVKWTDENGVAEFSPSTGTYYMTVEHENFSTMLIGDLHFESSKSYHIKINMTDCLSSIGDPICTPDVDDLIMYYKNKDPAMGTITPQGFVNYFADRLREYIGSEENCADGTLERMATKWGIYPDPPLNVLLYSYNFTKLECINDLRIWEITSTVKNYQQYSCEYTVTLIAGNTTTEIESGTLPPTWSLDAKKTDTSTVALESCDKDINMYLMVTSKRVDD